MSHLSNTITIEYYQYTIFTFTLAISLYSPGNNPDWSSRSTQQSYPSTILVIILQYHNQWGAQWITYWPYPLVHMSQMQIWLLLHHHMCSVCWQCKANWIECWVWTVGNFQEIGNRNVGFAKISTFAIHHIFEETVKIDGDFTIFVSDFLPAPKPIVLMLEACHFICEILICHCILIVPVYC